MPLELPARTEARLVAGYITKALPALAADEELTTSLQSVATFLMGGPVEILERRREAW